MPPCMFRLHDGLGAPPIEEFVDAIDDADARSLAELRILLTQAYSEVTIWRGAQRVSSIQRARIGKGQQ